MKLYAQRLDHFYFYNPSITAYAANVAVERIVVSEELAATEAFKAKKAHGKFPMLELADGTCIFESNAIAQFLARNANATELFGKSAFEEAQIESWQLIAATGLWPHTGKIAYNTFGH